MYDITIVNYDDPSDRVTLMFAPKELDFNPKTRLVPIASAQRNQPFYQYTGAEDTVVMQISYAANSEDRLDVIKTAKHLESWSKANGDIQGPATLKIIWGDESGLFSNAKFHLESAGYRFGLFDKVHRYLPTLAFQELVFKKIVDVNNNWDNIRDWRS